MISHLTSNTTVTPAKGERRHVTPFTARLFFFDLSTSGEGREGSQTPDQVRGDDGDAGGVIR